MKDIPGTGECLSDGPAPEVIQSADINCFMDAVIWTETTSVNPGRVEFVLRRGHRLIWRSRPEEVVPIVKDGGITEYHWQKDLRGAPFTDGYYELYPRVNGVDKAPIRLLRNCLDCGPICGSGCGDQGFGQGFTGGCRSC